MNPQPYIDWADSLLVEIGSDLPASGTTRVAAEQLMRDCLYVIIIINSKNHCRLGFHQILRALYASEERLQVAKSTHREYTQFIRSVVTGLPISGNPCRNGVEEALAIIQSLSPSRELLAKLSKETCEWGGQTDLACLESPAGKARDKRTSDVPDPGNRTKRQKMEALLPSDESGDDLFVRTRKPSTTKQSDLFRSPMPRWAPGDGNGDREQRQTWLYVAECPPNGISELPKYAVLSNMVVWALWKSKRYTDAELTEYWPLDFRIMKRQHLVLAESRRPRGASQICNSEWALLPVWHKQQVVHKPIPTNPQWGDEGYAFDRRVCYQPVWPTASSIFKVSHDDDLLNPAVVREEKPGWTIMGNVSLPPVDNDTLLLTRMSPILPNPELAACFANNSQFLEKLKRVEIDERDCAIFCKNIGSDFGAADVLILPAYKGPQPPLDEVHDQVVDHLRMASGACASRNKKKLVVGGLFRFGSVAADLGKAFAEVPKYGRAPHTVMCLDGLV